MCPRPDFARSLLIDNKAVSAVEFAIAFPVLLIMLLMGMQVILYINATRQIEMVATSISEMISQAAPPDQTTTIAKVKTVDLHFAYDASMVLFPYLMKDAARRNMPWWQDITIDFASINFTSNGKSCSINSDQSACYTAMVGWTSTGTVGSNYRPCLVPQLPTDNNTTPNSALLPRSLFGSGSIIAIDVAFTFTPTFATRLLPALIIRRSVFVQPRYATYIDLDSTGNDGMATQCPVKS